MRFFISFLSFFCAICFLTSCTSESASERWFPLASGHQWVYQSSVMMDDEGSSPLQEILTLKTLGSERIEGLLAWRRQSSSGINYWLREDDSGIYRVATKGPLDVIPKIDAEPRYVLKKPYVIGTAWESFTTTYILRRRNEMPHELRHIPDYKNLLMHYRIASINETVTVPAGQFQNCLRVDGVANIKLYVDEALTFREVPLTMSEWYCQKNDRGVGLVKVVRQETSPTKFIAGGHQTLELTTWH